MTTTEILLIVNSILLVLIFINLRKLVVTIIDYVATYTVPRPPVPPPPPSDVQKINILSI